MGVECFFLPEVLTFGRLLPIVGVTRREPDRLHPARFSNPNTEWTCEMAGQDISARVLALKLEHVTLEAAHALTEEEYGGCVDSADLMLLEQRLHALERRMRGLRVEVTLLQVRAARLAAQSNGGSL